MQSWSSGNAPSVHLPSIDELSSGRLSSHIDVLSVEKVDFAQMITAAGAQAVVDTMVDHFEITDTSMKDVITHSGPFFFRAHQHWMDRPGGLDELNKLARSGGPQQFAERPGLVRASVSQQEGQVFLKHLFLDDEVLGMVTQRITAQIDINSQKLDGLMPSLATLFVGLLCKSMVPAGP